MSAKTLVLVAFSGGKDSQASLIHTLKSPLYANCQILAVFCDTGWEHPSTYKFVHAFCKKVDVELRVLRSSRYAGLVDLAKQKGRFPSRTRQFCTEELKMKPMIDFVLDECRQNIIVIQGIRKAESKKRSQMSKTCRFFLHYHTPYSTDSNGNHRYHTYRKADVEAWIAQYGDDIMRPVFNWSADRVVSYIRDHGYDLNPLYYSGAKRVGCYPCINCSVSELRQRYKVDPSILTSVIDAEKEVGTTFFSPKFIPAHAQSRRDPKSGKPITTAEDVKRYIERGDATADMFADEDNGSSSCMSFFNICE